MRREVKLCGTCDELQAALMQQINAMPPRAEMAFADAAKTRTRLEPVVNIPIVFNCTGTTDQVNDPNLTDAQLEKQVEQLNADFHGVNFYKNAFCPAGNEHLLAGNAFINFYIQDIRRRYTRASSLWHADAYSTVGVLDTMKRDEEGGLAAVSVETALNVWCCYFSTNGTPYGNAPLGYAYLPNTGDPSAQSLAHVVVQSEVIGSDDSPSPASVFGGQYPRYYRTGHVLTHEVGHFLSLQHSWIPAGQCDSNIIDIPPHKEESGWDSIAYNSARINSCDVVDPYNNIMNYSIYLSSFTPLQVAAFYKTLFWKTVQNLYRSHEFIGTSIRPLRASSVKAARHGSSTVSKIYLGGTTVWNTTNATPPAAVEAAPSQLIVPLASGLSGSGTATAPISGTLNDGYRKLFVRALRAGRLKMTVDRPLAWIDFYNVELETDPRYPSAPIRFAPNEGLYFDEQTGITHVDGVYVGEGAEYEITLYAPDFTLVQTPCALSAVLEPGLQPVAAPPAPPPQFPGPVLQATAPIPGTNSTTARLTWSEPVVAGATVSRYFVDYKMATASTWTAEPATTQRTKDVYNLVFGPREWDFRVAAMSTDGVQGLWSDTVRILVP